LISLQELSLKDCLILAGRPAKQNFTSSIWYNIHLVARSSYLHNPIQFYVPCALLCTSSTELQVHSKVPAPYSHKRQKNPFTPCQAPLSRVNRLLLEQTLPHQPFSISLVSLLRQILLSDRKWILRHIEEIPIQLQIIPLNPRYLIRCF